MLTATVSSRLAEDNLSQTTMLIWFLHSFCPCFHGDVPYTLKQLPVIMPVYETQPHEYSWSVQGEADARRILSQWLH